MIDKKNILIVVVAENDLFCFGRNALFLKEYIESTYSSDLYKIRIECLIVLDNFMPKNYLHYPGGYKDLSIKTIYKSDIKSSINTKEFDYILYMKEDVVLWGNFIEQLLIPFLEDNKCAVSIPNKYKGNNNECLWLFSKNIFELYKYQIETINDNAYEKENILGGILNNGYRIYYVDDINVICYNKR